MVISPNSRKNAVDLIFALTGYAFFAMLYGDRSVEEVCALVKTACRSAIDSLQPASRKPVPNV